MPGSKLRFLTATVAASLLLSSMAGTAAAMPPPGAPATTAQSGASWLTLSMLTPSGSIGLAGAAVQPPNPSDNLPPPQADDNRRPPIPVIAIWLAEIALAIYILTKHHHGRVFLPHPNSVG